MINKNKNYIFLSFCNKFSLKIWLNNISIKYAITL